MIAKLPVCLQTVGLLVQLKITQALITRAVFVLFALLALGQALKLDFLEAGFA